MNKIKINIKHFFIHCCILRYTVFCTLVIAMFIPSTLLAQPDWHVRMKIESGASHNVLILGADDTASDGFDNLWDTHALFGSDIRAYFPHDEWNRDHNKFWRDIKSNDTGMSKSWPVTIDIDPDSSLLNETFTITWDLSMIPQDYTVTLTDDTTGQQIDMRATPLHSFIFTASRSFSVAVNIPMCNNNPFRITGTIPAFYLTLQEAYGAADEGDVIQIQKTSLSGDANLNLNKTVTIDGGFKCDYSETSGTTTMNSNLLISNGTVLISNLILQ